jgi:hypothetical protein
MTSLNVFAYGMMAALSLVIAAYFGRYWRASRDRFFVFFALAFVGLAATWATLAAAGREEHYVYLPRLLAFLLILVAIIDKNRRSR